MGLDVLGCLPSAYSAQDGADCPQHIVKSAGLQICRSPDSIFAQLPAYIEVWAEIWNQTPKVSFSAQLLGFRSRSADVRVQRGLNPRLPVGKHLTLKV